MKTKMCVHTKCNLKRQMIAISFKKKVEIKSLATTFFRENCRKHLSHGSTLREILSSGA